MNTPADSLYESPVAPQRSTATAIPPLQQLVWSVRRELWENRSVYLAPLIAAGVVLLGFLIAVIRLAHRTDLPPAVEAARRNQVMLFPYDIAAGIIMLTAGIVSILYCLEALHGERRDRSILFWKSLPVSDLTAVLAKASIPLLILPLVAFATTVATQLLMLLVSSAAGIGGGGTAPSLWAHAALFQMSWMLLYHFFTVHSLWYAPLYGWLLLVSAWARRATFLWAFLPPIALCILERIIFNTTHLANMFTRRLSGAMEAMPAASGGMSQIHPGMQITLGRYVTAPGLWVGLALAALFLTAAIHLRRSRGAI